MKDRRIPIFYYRLFSWICKPELFEELQGDLEEAFYENEVSHGLKKARSIYRIEVIKMIRPSVLSHWKINSKLNFLIMYKNYFKTSIRSLMKNPMSSIINLTGLSAAIGICVFAYAFTQFTIRVDQFHENKDKVFLVTFFADREGEQQQIGTTPRPLGKLMSEEFPEIESVCRVENGQVIVKSKDNVFNEAIRYVDPSFLKMFTFPLKWGHSNSLTDLNSIILSEEMAIKYFGNENPLGQNLLIKFEKDNTKSFQITGVAEAFPEDRSLSFSFLINYENVKIVATDYNQGDWSQTVHATLIQLNKPEDIESVAQGMDKYRLLQNASENEWKINSYGFEPLSTIHYRSKNVRDDIFFSLHENYESLVFLYVVSGFLLLLACFNYINIAIVSAAKRLKEISVRKVVGASRSMITFQFLSENIFLTAFAAFIGLILGSQLFIPWFEELFDFKMGFVFGDLKLYGILLGIVLFTGVFSGLYPALYIAKFQAVSIMKGSLKFGKKNTLTTFLLGFQLVLASLLITTGVMFTMNNNYIAKRSWGYGQEDRVYVSVPDYSSYEQMRTRMLQNPNVLSLAGSKDHIGKGESKVVVERPDREYEVVQMSIGPNYLETMGIQLLKGEKFKVDHESDKSIVLVNETFTESLGFEDPIGEVIKIEGIRFTIAGVVKDFHNRSFSSLLKPTVLRLSDKEDFRYLTIKARQGSQFETYADLQAQWASVFPEDPFQGGNQEDVWGFYFTSISSHGKFWSGIAFIAILIAALGIYGLVTLNVTSRMQEFSIRKVLGAKIENIGGSVVKGYLILFGIAIMIGAPLSYYAVDFLLNFAYHYHVPMNVSGVMTAVLTLVFVLLSVVLIQMIRLSRANPVVGLRNE